MRIQQNTDVQNNLYSAQGTQETIDTDVVRSNDKGNNVSVSGAGLKIQSLLEQRQGFARKNAFKVVADAFDGEKKLDAQMQSIKDQIKSLAEELNELKEQRKSKIESGELKDLMIEYGVEPYSREYKELEEYSGKVRDPQQDIPAEEYDKLTEFQKKALHFFTSDQEETMEMKAIENKMAALVSGYADIKRERLKSHAMIDAQKEAENIMDASNKETIALLTNDAVENIDEEQKEREEEAKEAAEEKKEEKKKEAAKLEKEAQWEELIDDIKDSAELSRAASAETKRAIARRERSEAEDSDPGNYQKVVITEEKSLEEMQEDVNAEITNILNKLRLLSDDVKGTSVDNLI